MAGAGNSKFQTSPVYMKLWICKILLLPVVSLIVLVIRPIHTANLT